MAESSLNVALTLGGSDSVETHDGRGVRGSQAARRRRRTCAKSYVACSRIKQVPPDEARKLIAEFDDPAFSREVLGLGDDYEPFCSPTAD